MLRRHSGKDLDDIEDDADFNIYEHLMGGKGDDPQNSSIGISLIRPPQRRASLSKERSNKIPEGYITSDSNQLKFRWLSLMAFFSAIGLLAVLASNKQISFSFSFPSMSNNLVDDKLASIGSEKKPSDIPFFWHIPRSAGTSFKLISSKCLGFVLAAEYGNDAISDTKVRSFYCTLIHSTSSEVIYNYLVRFLIILKFCIPVTKGCRFSKAER